MAAFYNAMDEEVRSLFHEILDLAPPERERFFAERQVESEVRAELESLLRFASAGQDWSACVAGVAAEALGAEPDPGMGGCGPYRLVRLLGRGGMGAVYLGERVDGEIQKKAAIKLLAGHHPGWRERFLKERQLLASLNHPFIVHVIDAGHTGAGQPYLVMEYVEGIPIDVYSAAIPLRERLKLFLRVCDGVSHAHRHLVIHRDLKPSNILVDTSGQPKLLDFGIAKLLDDPGDITQPGDRLFTLNYASPEQLRAGPQTTATDVYSLGAVLYNLLTGRQPYSLANATPAERERIVCDQPPTPPRLGGELDAILLTALRKEADQRYSSVQDFADDIERYLENRPVRAKPHSRMYRARKYLRRHGIGVLAASIALAGICTGGGVAVYQARLARRQFNQVRDLANRFLFDFHDEIQKVPGTVKARQMVVSTALEYLNRLANESAGDPALQWELAVAFGKVGSAQGSLDQSSLGQYRQALDSYHQAFALARPLAARNRLDARQKAEFARLLNEAARIHVHLREYAPALAVAREAVAMSAGLSEDVQLEHLSSLANILAYLGDLVGSERADERVVAVAREEIRKNPTAAKRATFADRLSVLGIDQHRLSRLDEAKASQTEAVEMLQSLVAEQPQSVPALRLFHTALVRLGDVLGACDRPNLGRFDEAAARYEEAIRVLVPASAADPNDRSSRVFLGLAHLKIACSLSDGEPARALQHATAATRLLDLAASDRAELRAQPRIFAANAHRASGDFATAEILLTEAARFLSERDRNTQADLSLAWARLEWARKHQEPAERWFRRAMSDTESLYQKTSTPFYAWELSRVLELAAQALPALAPSCRQRITAVWQDQNRRFPGEPFIENRLLSAKGEAGAGTPEPGQTTTASQNPAKSSF